MPLKPYVRGLALIALGTLAGVLVAPADRNTTLRVALLAVAVLGAIALVHLASTRTRFGGGTPFDLVPRPVVEPTVPVELTRLAADLDLATTDHSRRLGGTTAERIVRDLVTHRLERDRGIVTADPLEEPAAAEFLGPQTVVALRRRADSGAGAVDPARLAEELEAL
jgi:hypothetical protein